MLVIGPMLLFSMSAIVYGTSQERILISRKLGSVSKLLRYSELNCTTESVEFDQSNYIESILKKFHMDDCKPSQTPMELKLSLEAAKKDDPLANSSSIPYRSALGCIQYLVTGSRPDLAYSGQISSVDFAMDTHNNIGMTRNVFSHNPRATSSLKLQPQWCRSSSYSSRTQEISSHSVCRCRFQQRARWQEYCTGFVTDLNGQFISGKSWKQQMVTESTSEAELVAANEGAKDGLWLKY